LWDSNSPPHTELGWEGVKLGLLPPKERWGRSPSWTPTPQGWPATLATYIKEGGGAPRGHTSPRRTPGQPPPLLLLCPSHHLHKPDGPTLPATTVYFIHDAGALPGRLPRHQQRPCGVPDLHRHVPASTACLITLRRGDALPVRVDTVEVLHLRHLIVGTNTSPRDQTSLIAGIDERLHQHSASTKFRKFDRRGYVRYCSFYYLLLVLLAYDLGYALVKILFYVARSPTVVSERSMHRHRYG